MKGQARHVSRGKAHPYPAREGRFSALAKEVSSCGQWPTAALDLHESQVAARSGGTVWANLMYLSLFGLRWDSRSLSPEL